MQMSMHAGYMLAIKPPITSEQRREMIDSMLLLGANIS